jgi:hypothetical protein
MVPGRLTQNAVENRSEPETWAEGCRLLVGGLVVFFFRQRGKQRRNRRYLQNIATHTSVACHND